MNRQFHFKGFDPDAHLRSYANLVLDRLLDRSPYGATAVALLEKEDRGFRCLLDIYSTQGPFITSAVGKTALDALHAMEEKMVSKINRWMDVRMEKESTHESFTETRFFLGNKRGVA